MKTNTLWTCVCLLALVAAPALAGEDALESIGEESAGRSGGFRSVGIGGGVWVSTEDEKTEGDDDKQRFALGIETKWGWALDGGFSLYFALDMAIHDWETIEGIYTWLFQKDDYTLVRLFLGFPIIFLAPFAGSYSLTGVGFSWHSSPDGTAAYLDFGIGLSAFLRPSDDTFLFGAGFWGGGGIEFTETVGLGVRVMWSPPFLKSFFSESDSHIVAVTALLNLVSW